MSEGEPLPTKGSVLMSASKHLARSCREVNAAFMDCKARDLNPSACLKQGEAVTECLLKLCVASSGSRDGMFGCIVMFGRDNGYDVAHTTLLTLGCIALWTNCRLKRLHSEAPEEFNNYVKCMDYHRYESTPMDLFPDCAVCMDMERW